MLLTIMKRSYNSRTFSIKRVMGYVKGVNHESMCNDRNVNIYYLWSFCNRDCIILYWQMGL